jgi:molybdopterin molybdotransferase
MTSSLQEEDRQNEQRQRFLKLLPYEEIKKKIQSAFFPIGVESVYVDQALGRVSAETVHSEHDIPGRSISAMDGYAIDSDQTIRASVREPVHFTIKSAPRENLGVCANNGSSYVSTGSPLPYDANAVVRIEEARRQGQDILVTRRVSKWDNVSMQGEDIRAGDLVLEKSCIINSAKVALLIACSRRKIKVRKIPKVGIISIGAELDAFHHNEDQGRESPRGKINNYFNLIQGYLANLGLESKLVGIVDDDPKAIRDLINRELEDHDVLITIGGTSVGKSDLTHDAVLLAQDASMIFHGVRVVPIRPAGLASVKNKPVVMLPGHAVSVALSFFMVALPTLNVLCDLPLDARRPVINARALWSVSNDRGIDALELVKIKKANDTLGYCAEPLGWGSNLMSNLSKANGFVHLRAREKVAESDVVKVELLGSAELTRIACS